MLKEVSQSEFFSALYADKRDIMPTTRDPEVTVWEVQYTRKEWGRTLPGWRNAGLVDPQYFIHVSTP